MMETAPQYFRVAVRVLPEETPALAHFMNRDREEATREFFSQVRDRMPEFKKAAAATGRGPRASGTLRQISLYYLEEFLEAITFLKGNRRRPKVRNLLKSIILAGYKPQEPPWHGQSPFEGLPSPDELFTLPPDEILDHLCADLMPMAAAGALSRERARFDWLAVPPRRYPKVVQEVSAFAVLAQIEKIHLGQ